MAFLISSLVTAERFLHLSSGFHSVIFLALNNNFSPLFILRQMVKQSNKTTQ